MKNPKNCIDDGGGVRWPVNFYFFGKIEILLPQEFTQKEFCKLLGGNSLGSQAAVNGWANCYKNKWAKKEVGLDVLLGLHPDVSGLRLQHSIEPIQAETPDDDAWCPHGPPRRARRVPVPGPTTTAGTALHSKPPRPPGARNDQTCLPMASSCSPVP